MLEEATDELLSRDRAALNVIGGRLFIGESDVAVLQLTEAVVADSDAKDVGGEVLESLARLSRRVRKSTTQSLRQTRRST